MNNNSRKLINDLEKDIANLLLDKLEFSDMTLERAQLISRFALAHLPENLTDDQLKQVLHFLDDEFIELAEITNKYMNKLQMKEEEILAQNVQSLIKNGKLEEASMKMHEYFQKKLPL